MNDLFSAPASFNSAFYHSQELPRRIAVVRGDRVDRPPRTDRPAV